MNNKASNRILIVGAGPKAIAICSKAQVLREIGLNPPEIVVIDKAGVAANWMGKRGYTDGKRPLATSPEKDLGFPYRPGFLLKSIDPSVAKKIKENSSIITDRMLCYSWAAYLISTSQYDDWIDRGWLRPPHSAFGTYLEWAVQKCGVKVIPGDVNSIEPTGNQWTVTYECESQGERASRDELVDGVVITGPGAPRGSFADHPFISNGETFWAPPVIDGFRNFDEGRIAVVGGGDTSAVVVTALLELLKQPEKVKLHIFTKTGLTFSRDIGYGLTKYFSFPRGWNQLPWSSRHELVKRTAENSVSEVSASILVRARNVEVKLGKVVKYVGEEKRVELHVEGGSTESYERVIIATGFNPLACTKLLPSAMFPHKLEYKTMIHRVSRNIRADMSYKMPKAFGKVPRLHLPMLAARSQGPGFPTLECLGLLADRVLSPYL